MLDNLNLVHMNGRMHDPVLGRFVSADPFITEPGNSQNYNRYSYVYNNPLTAVDPTGFGTEDEEEDEDDEGDGSDCRGGGSACADAAAADAAAAASYVMGQVTVTGYVCGAQCMRLVGQLAAQWDAYLATLDLGGNIAASGPVPGGSQGSTDGQNPTEQGEEVSVCNVSVNGAPSPAVAAVVTRVQIDILSHTPNLGPLAPVAAWGTVAVQRAYQLYPGHSWDPRHGPSGNRIFGSVTAELGVPRGLALWTSGLIEQVGRNSNTPYDPSNGSALPPSGNFGNSPDVIQSIDEGKDCAN